MCGINGFRGVNSNLLDSMNQKIAHRGPDYSGAFIGDSVSLGHNLLSIREVSNLSKQPYRKDGSPWILLFNGQLYNTTALKKDLGPVYQNVDLDTALLFGIIEKCGWDFTPKIQGMFSIALYNKVENVIRLYRDTSGQKLLYYYHKNDQFIFSSEIKSILVHKNIDRDVDSEAVLLAVSLGYIPGGNTLFKHIKKTNLGEVISVDLKTNTLTKSYFKTDASGYYEGSTNVFEDLVKEHLQSKQRVALNLSGGLDSSLLLHEMSKAGHSMYTYTNHFTDCGESYNTDALLARRLAKDYGSEHTEIQITKESFLKNFTESYKTIEEPNYNISLPAYLQTAKVEGVNGDKNRVILSGDGGDEVFGGYSYYLKSSDISAQAKMFTPFFYNLVKNHRAKTSYDFSNAPDRWMYFKDFYFKAILHGSTTKNQLAEVRHIVDEFTENFSQKKGALYETMLMDRVLWLGGENFIRSDKLYMSQSLELRSPLSYHPFRVHFDKLLTEKDYINKRSNKLFLRAYYKDKLPSYITARVDKSGWTSPIKEWYDGEYKQLFLDIISEVQSNDSIIDWKKVKTKIEKSSTWPGKYIHLYLSLAILAKEFNIKI